MSSSPAGIAPTLRTARAADLPILQVLESLFPGDRLSARQLRHHLSNPHAVMRVIETEYALAGYSLLLTRSGSQAARLYSIAVAPAFRGQGMGRQLLDDVVAQARARGCNELRLEVRQDNEPAIRLYREYGFQFTEQRPRYYQDGADALRFRLEISAS
ncbi:MAG: ribosomal protein S18-alanine N-acetyltransferase [Rhodanobacteraceae bacterium]|nr:ribosomal protein S18-alanine N-acetyltransferase [Xanthomonadales bacterium]MCP5479268.1 ribosomal protein S18-alanine N-acetyltransferase [Rhodanobacteraceae bacterium]HPF73356.1 ribosomal protein S18-alanine N-acetyltransferase [Xanthomonadaceae bacterium]HRX98786.1 ribosomal protein S18-alanine N-acetyltransferase [Xanthomonadaceae bacterium]